MISTAAKARIRLALALVTLAPLAVLARWMMSPELHTYVIKRGAAAWRRYDASTSD